MTWSTMRREMRRSRALYLMLLPVLLYFSIFTYWPMVRGFIMSMQDVRLAGDSLFIRLENYRAAFGTPLFWRALRNTLAIGGGTLIVGFVTQVAMALLLNEIYQRSVKRLAQTAVYLPHLFSWVVVGGIWISLLSPDSGLVNAMLRAVGLDPIPFMTREPLTWPIFIFTGVWKSAGYGAIIYLAAITRIDPQLYEAASIDGADRWQQTLNITLPGLYSTMVVVFLLNMMGVLRIFDQSFVMTNPAIFARGDVLMTYTHRVGILQFKFGYASAVAFIVVFFTFLLSMFYQRVTSSGAAEPASAEE